MGLARRPRHGCRCSRPLGLGNQGAGAAAGRRLAPPRPAAPLGAARLEGPTRGAVRAQDSAENIDLRLSKAQHQGARLWSPEFPKQRRAQLPLPDQPRAIPRPRERPAEVAGLASAAAEPPARAAGVVELAEARPREKALSASSSRRPLKNPGSGSPGGSAPGTPRREAAAAARTSAAYCQKSYVLPTTASQPGAAGRRSANAYRLLWERWMTWMQKILLALGSLREFAQSRPLWKC